MSDIDRPIGHDDPRLFGSDALADMMRHLGLPYLALNPGSSYRGLHDSLVNHLGNRDPQMLVCLHEEHAVSIAHGWAKVTGTPMGVMLHANVGLMHGAMAIYNAWCDRVPMAIYGATGPVDSAKRRPWIDWVHTARDQTALVRDFVKWDDQPVSLGPTLTAMAEAHRQTRTIPHGPTYVVFDVSLQEAQIETLPPLPDPARFAPAPEPLPEIEGLVAQLRAAQRPVLMMGRLGCDPQDWANRVALAEGLGAKVLTDIKTRASFPTDHPAHMGPPGYFLTADQHTVLRDADLIVSFDWVDVAGTVKAAGAEAVPLVQVSPEGRLARGTRLDLFAPVAADLLLETPPDPVVRACVAALDLVPTDPPMTALGCPALSYDAQPGPMNGARFAAALGEGLRDQPVCLARLPLSWGGATWHFRHPLDYLGYDGGAGIGSGPGMVVGAALALRDAEDPRICVGVLGDGDTMMGISALWTAARYDIPCLIVVANNRSYFNDEVHQEKIALTRGRPVENKAVGQAIADPDLDFAALARAQGVQAFGPVAEPSALVDALCAAVPLVQAGQPVLIDARIEPGYAPEMAGGMTG